MIRHLAATAAVTASTGLLASRRGLSGTTEKPVSGVFPQVRSLPRLAKAAVLVDQLMAEKYGSALGEFDVTMAAAMPEYRLVETLTQLAQHVGPFQERTDIRQAEEGGCDVIYITAIFERGTVNIKVVYDDAGKVTGLFFLPQ